MCDPWRMRLTLPCPAQGSWLDDASVYGCARQCLRGVGIWAMRYPSGTRPCHLKPSALALSVSKTAEYLRVFRASSGNERGRSFLEPAAGQGRGRQEVGRMRFGLLRPPHTLQDFWGLGTDFLKGQVSRNTKSNNRRNTSNNQVGHSPWSTATWERHL